MIKPILRVKKVLLAVACGAFLTQGLSCQEIVFVNMVTGLRDGLAGAASGIVSETFNIGFNLEETEEEAGHEHGDDAFVEL